MFKPAAALTINPVEKERLQQLVRSGKTPQKIALRARIVLAAADGNPNNAIAKALKISRPTVLLWRARFQDCSVGGLLKNATSPGRKRKVTTEPIKNALFALLHSPPSQHNINRTSWRLADIRQCLLKNGISISRVTISRIVRAAGYKWRKAAEVLTSNDSEYQEKLHRIKSVLSTLGKNKRFFSIDEYGPFAVRMKGRHETGRSGRTPTCTEISEV